MNPKLRVILFKSRKNIWDGKIKLNTVISTSAGVEGDFVTNANSRTTDKIKVKAGDILTVSGGNRNVWRFEDESETKITFTPNNLATVTAPANAYYAYVYYSNDGTHTLIQVEANATSTPIESY